MTENFVKDRQTDRQTEGRQTQGLNGSPPSPSDRGYNDEIEYTKKQDICEPILTSYTPALLI